MKIIRQTPVEPYATFSFRRLVRAAGIHLGVSYRVREEPGLLVIALDEVPVWWFNEPRLADPENVRDPLLSHKGALLWARVRDLGQQALVEAGHPLDLVATVLMSQAFDLASQRFKAARTG